MKDENEQPSRNPHESDSEGDVTAPDGDTSPVPAKMNARELSTQRMSPGLIFDCCIISLAPADHASIRLIDEPLPASCCCWMTANPGNGSRNGHQLHVQLTRSA